MELQSKSHRPLSCTECSTGAKYCELTNTHYIDIRGDGLCFYRCLALFLQKDMLAVKEAIIEEIFLNWESYKCFFVFNGKCIYNNAQDYKMKNLTRQPNRCWEYATDVEIGVSSKLFKVNIAVINVGNGVKTPMSPAPEPMNFFGNSNNVSKFAIRATNHLTEAAHFQLFTKVPSMFVEQFEGFFLELEGASVQDSGFCDELIPSDGNGSFLSDDESEFEYSFHLSDDEIDSEGSSTSDEVQFSIKNIEFNSPRDICSSGEGQLNFANDSNGIGPDNIFSSEEVESSSVVNSEFSAVGDSFSSNEDDLFVSSDVDGDDFDVADVGLNPFDPPYEDLEDVDDPGVPQPPQINCPSGRNASLTPPCRPRGCWNVDKLPFIINKKPLSSRLSHNRETYRVGALYGGEDLSKVKEVDFGSCSELCSNCNAKYWKAELSRTREDPGLKCCTYGKFKLPESSVFRRPDQVVFDLLVGNTEQAKKFQQEILKYNKLFATCFLSGDFLSLGARNYGLWALKVNGEVKWHNHSYRDPGDESRPPNHGQVFFLDYSNDNEDEIIRQRRQGLRYNEELSNEVLTLLERYLRENNTYVQAYRTTKEIEAQEEELARMEGREVPDVVLVINPKEPGTRVTRVGASDYLERLRRGGQYNITPVADGVGAVFSGRLPPMTYDAMYFPREQREGERAPGAPNPSMRTLDIMMFPLLHMHGETAHLEFSQVRRDDRVPSLAEYYRYRLGIRDDEFSLLHKLKKLFAFYLLNAGLRVLYDWLSYRASHQQTLKSESYKTLQRFVTQEAHRQNRRIGKIVVLPPGIYGSPRHMKDLFYDALAVSQKLGHPSWMITLTCNRNWKEIKEECRRSETDPNFRYDVVNRAFEMRANQLYSDIVREQIFGRVLGEMTVREFQGRGLTHTHALFIMRPEDTPTSSEDIDRVICASFPDENENPHLFELVKKFMVHGPCDSSSPCHKKTGKCKHGFPFDFREVTDISGKRPLYRRPSDGRGFWKNVNGVSIFIDNRWVIPHSPFCLIRFVGHLNVMYSPSTSGCKYFYGYLLKGSYGNRIRTSIAQKIRNVPEGERYDHDEIKEFKEMRHMGPYEAHYYIMSNSQAHIYPPVEVLPVHLKDEENIIHVEGRELHAVDRHENTKLTAWFDLNKEPGPHRGKLYVDVVENYMYEKNVWRRSNRHTIGRMYPLASTDFNSDLYHLRVLLCNRTDVTSFEDIRTVDGYIHPTNKSACIALNLVENEEDLRLIMDQLIIELFPSTLRKTFATLLFRINPCNPRSLWDEYHIQMAEDFMNELGDEHLSFQLTLQDIAHVLEEFGKTLEDYNLPALDEAVLAHRNVCSNFEYLTVEEADLLVDQLNQEQRLFFNDVVGSVLNENNKKHFFLTGPGGTGKTFTYNVLIDFLLAQGKKVVVAAYTGVAANLLKLGTTSHKAFGLPFDDKEAGLSRSNLKLQSKEAQQLLECDLIIWDEVSMVQAWHLHVLDRFLRDLMKSKDPFGGKRIVLGGDFRQILPVVPGGGRVDIVDAAITSSNLWPLFKPYHLIRNQRAVDDEDFANFLLQVGDGVANEPNSTEFHVPSNMIVSGIHNLINHCFGKDIDKEDSHDAAILCPTNAAAQFVNQLVLERLLRQSGGEAREYFSSTSLEKSKELETGNDEQRLHYPPEYLNRLESASIPPHKLHLVPGANVMLIRNLRVGGGLCNGTRLKILKLLPNLLICKIMTGSRKGETVAIFRILFTTNEFSLPGKLRRRQFPIKLCYAITVNKSQGQTLIREGLYLRTPLWCHGQLYVALSRVKTRSAVKILVEEGPDQGRINANRGASLSRNNIFTHNHVYREVLEVALQGAYQNELSG